jgi:hypothetical protein
VTGELEFTYNDFVMVMNKSHLEKILKKELFKLNDMIDAKVVMGLPYKNEAREHRILLARLISLKKAQHPWLSKLGAIPTLFF